MVREQLFASFMLDRDTGLEIALRAESVAEATPLSGPVQKLPSSVGFVEGLMHLREEVIPVINLKKRLGLASDVYGDDAMVAVVMLAQRRFGLLFDDIREVFGAQPADILKVDEVLQNDDRIISSLIRREKGVRTIELLELGNLFQHGMKELEAAEADFAEREVVPRTFHRYVVFSYAEQLYGIPVEFTQEITFFSAIKQMFRGGIEGDIRTLSNDLEDIFKHGDIDGTLVLRGKTIPVLSAGRLLSGGKGEFDEYLGEDTRILVLSNGHCAIGLIVEEVRSIEPIIDDEVMPVEVLGNSGVSGMYAHESGRNIILLDVERLICSRAEELKAMARLSDDNEKQAIARAAAGNGAGAHHLITENCYLVFSAEKRLAVQLRDVQEIIERQEGMMLPGVNGYHSGVINLRGKVVPVVSLREFYGHGPLYGDSAEQRLVICAAAGRLVALEVDNIVTIYKQEKSQQAGSNGSSRNGMSRREDTLDRLIVFESSAGRREHVLVVNIHSLIRNYVEIQGANEPDEEAQQ